MEDATTSEFGLDATAIVGCGISLFFCTISIVAFIFFRPRTESFMIKQHLTLAVGLTQIVLLLSIAAYRKKEGCQAMSIVIHYFITSCFSWCLVDSLFLYFNHTNSSHPLRKHVYYFLLGWGFPVTVIAMSLAIGFRASKGPKPSLDLYSCWHTDHIVWTFVIPSLLIATLNVMVLCVVLRQLRQPSYDICARAVLEKRCTRYGLRTNSLMLLGLCLGWIFGILSFREVENVRFQLSFGLINGLQGIFLFFFHCVLNIDIKGYYQSGVHRCSHEDGCLTDRERSRRGNPQVQDPQVGSRRKISSKSHPATENIPLISVGSQSRSQEASSSHSQSSEPKNEHQPIEVAVVSRDESEPVPKGKEDRPQNPDHDAYPSLPGTPEPTIPEMSVQQTKRKSLPPELSSKRTKEEVEGLSKSATLTSLSKYNKRPVTESYKQHPTPAEHLGVHHKVEKSHSEPVIPPPEDQPKPAKKPHSGHVHSHVETRKLSVQSSASAGGGSERKPRRTSRTHQGASLNELESLFSSPIYVKPHRPSVSSLHGTSSGGERKHSNETVQRPGSRTSSRNTEETML